ncbi:unnamed protein product [Adineta steineri]|uniref:Glycosyltransferase family 28 N-terminal domain-containing protein n=2 Tax=Adineta steineri TaxID=433720 RepID=A0A813VZA4_9BILA|nr:unnamed protein product [Adineta steineri]CAF3763036.1 unnamed protein product [Adineta steineri]
MSETTDDLSKINFDSDWQCCQQTIDKIDDVTISTLTSMHDDYQWVSVKLPHNLEIKKKNYNCWYRKQFNWIISEEQPDQQIDLSFKSSKNDTNLNISDATVTIWLNKVQIFSGSSMSLKKSIELTKDLLHDQETKNTLLILCINMSLSFHARLKIHGKVVYATGQIPLDDKIIDDTKNSTEENKDSLQYTVSFNDNDGRIGIEFDPKQKLDAFLSSSSSKVPSKPIINEKHENLDDIPIPRLAIAILIVGTRGDVQPFIALGQALHAAGHRVRLATHEPFRSFVRGNGLEFYPLAGDPADLIAFMVKNSGVIPSMSSIVAGDITKKRQSLAEILASTWNACTANDDETSVPFTAEVIIANPPSFGHIHCAEKLQIPLHMMFTMPWSPTTAFPHPLCNIDNTKGPSDKVNFYSYDVFEMLTWSGMGDLVNNFRTKILGLEPLNNRQAIRALVDEQVPHTYCWSPFIVPKPNDWGPHIDVSGFFFLDLGTTFANPPEDLLNFLGLNPQNNDNNKLSPPIYIGFGSIAGHDSARILKVIVEAINITGYRALLSGFGADKEILPDNIFKIGNVPHDWLFQYVSAVCHHGGAGTTAAGLRAGKPTIIVPFFGDQFFWANIIEKNGAGPAPQPGKTVTADELAEAFRFVHKPTTREAAERIRDSLLKEDGCTAAVQAFHANLPLSRMHSDLESTFPACYRLDKYKLQISRPVAQVLVSAGIIEESDLSYHATREWQFMYDSYMGIPTAGLMQHTVKGLSSMFIDSAKGIKQATGAKDAAGSVAKGVGVGVGHLTMGCLSFYGEITDVLDRAPSLYDPYSEPSTYKREHVTDFKSGAKAAGQSLWHGWKDGFTGLVKEPYVGYQRHGKWGGAGGALLGSVNVLVKPAAATFSSITWLGRGTFASAKKALKNRDGDKKATSIKVLDSPSTTEDKQHQENDKHESDVNDNDNDISQAAKKAANISDFHPTVCQHILDEFDKIKIQHDQPQNIAKSPNKESHDKFHFRWHKSSDDSNKK